jgi:hypothetical protein
LAERLSSKEARYGSRQVNRLDMSIIVLRVGGATIFFKNLYINSIPAFADLLADTTWSS